jgi:hypothetical protein
MSAGEEQNGQYQVFVEIERSEKIKEQLQDLMSGLSQLTDCYDWRFRYQKAPRSVEFTEESILEHIPMTSDSYENKMLEIKTKDVKEFFNQGAVGVALESNNTLTFSKPYAGDIKAKFISIGEYDDVKETVPGKLDINETSQGQVLFLNKFLGNYDINKIGNKFLIRNGKQAVVIEKDRW